MSFADRIFCGLAATVLVLAFYYLATTEPIGEPYYQSTSTTTEIHE